MRIGSKGWAAANIDVIRAPMADPEVTHAPPLRMAIELASPVQGKLRDFILDNRKTEPLSVVQPNTHCGKTLAICGAGPSLRDARIDGVDQVWACNSALPYLVAGDVHVDAAIGVDQTPGLLREWVDAPDVPYLLASTCDPALVAHLQLQGRSVSFFHNHVGCDENEFDLYCKTWPPTIMVGEGFSVVSRVIGLARWMGFDRVDIYGADCSFAADDVAHANGDSAVEAYHNPLIMQGQINGRTYRTRPDMLMDAVHLVRRVKKEMLQDRPMAIRLIGDTLPVALLGKPDSFLDEVSRRLAPGELPPS